MTLVAPRIPEIIAHRGASRESLENTMPAFARALAMRVDGIELDIHGTADGVLVVHHDPVVTLPAGDHRPLAAMTWPDVAAHRLRGGEQIPTLAMVLDLVGDQATVYVEVKGHAIEPLVIATLDQFPHVRTAVHAFDHRIPMAIRGRRPATSIGLLSASYPLDVAAWLADARPDAVWQHAGLIDAALVEAVHGFGARLIAWTENDAPHARQLAAWGVDGLCSDVPDRIRAALSEAPPED